MNRCICGAAVINLSQDSRLLDDDPRNVWVHESGSDTRCTEARPINDVTPDRDLIRGAAEQMSNLITRSRRAAGELERVQSAVAELIEELNFMRAELTYHGVIQRTVLLEAWDVLVNAGDLNGAKIVRDMIKDVK